MQYKDGVIVEMIVIKNGKRTVVKPSEPIEHAKRVADALSERITGKEAICTALFDGKHMEGSLHYSGNAFDMRTFIYTPEQIQTIFLNLKDNLGKDYDIVLHKTHIHVEYDPK